MQCQPVLARTFLPAGAWREFTLPGFPSVPAPELAAPNPSTVVVNAGPYDGGARLAIGVDGGRRWRFSAPTWMGRPCDDGGTTWTDVPGIDPEGVPAAFDVLSPKDAWLLAAGQGLWRTTDGRHWRAVGPVAVSL